MEEAGAWRQDLGEVALSPGKVDKEHRAPVWQPGSPGFRFQVSPFLVACLNFQTLIVFIC